ncbi:MAG TPA: aminoacyl-tRNA hydrolase [Burkholderiaceae bacterium]|nr:aminoacyl-tRNA hydrolase [Burkholderiaceae bacterium]
MKPPVRLIVGLGNPGPEYEATRHNAGFWLLDHFADDLGTAFSLDKAMGAWVAKAHFDSRLVVLAKPANFMNRSGLPCASLLNFYKFSPAELLVVHDELDLLPGQAKLKFGGGHAGHNGLRDIHRALASSDYWRMRIGIGHPRNLGITQQVVSYVLSPPRRQELDQISSLIDRCRAVLPSLLRADYALATEELHAANSSK